MKPADILLLTTEKETAGAVRAATESSSVRGSPDVCKSMAELRARFSRGGAGKAPGIVIVDIDEHPQQILFELSRMISTNPGKLFVVVSREFNETLVLQAMQAGARHFLRKSSIASELDAVIERLLLHGSERPTRQGDVIAVFGCSGGCGATTVAVNLAMELRLAAEKPVLLVDLDPYYGSIAPSLSLEGKYGIAHLLNREGPVDAHLIETSLVKFTEGLDVLLSPATAKADAGQTMEYEHLLQVLDACRETHSYVIVDAPRIPEQAVDDLASICRLAVVVLQLTVRDIAFARMRISWLLERGMTPDRILALANRVKRRGPLVRVADTQRALGVKPLYCVRSDWRKAIRSLNRGQPLAHSSRFSGLRRDFRKIAAQVQRYTANGHSPKGGA